MSLAVVIVTYNSADVIARCLNSCLHLRTVVVDNASEDGTLAELKKLSPWKLLANERNLGFAAAVNQGVRECGGEYVLLLNPDAELLGSPEPLLDASRRTGAGIVGGRLVGEDGADQRGFTFRRFPTPATLAFEALGLNRAFPWNPLNRAYRCLDRDLDQAGDVDQPAGALLLFRRDLWERLGGFDESFHPVWFEDVDFCKRASQTGSRIYYLPSVAARHTGGQSVRSTAWESRELGWYVSLLRYASKHFRRLSRWGVGGAVAVGAVLRSPIAMARGRSLKPVAVYSRVFRLAAGFVWHGGLPDGQDARRYPWRQQGRERSSTVGQIHAPED